MPTRDYKHEGSSQMSARGRSRQGRSDRGKPPAAARYKFAAPLQSLLAAEPASQPRGSRFEGLEKRLLWSVSYDTNGWTVVSPSVDTKVIYVSSSLGSDNNSGLTTANPVKSFAKAESLVAVDNGKPDWILLNRGDVFNDAFLNWKYSGRSVQEPMLVSYYGTGALPQVYSGTNPAGFATPINQNSTIQVNYVDVIGLQFQANLFNPSSPNFSTASAGGGTGFYFYNPGGNVLLEDDSFEYYKYNMDIEGLQGVTGNITIRRCVDDYAYCPNYGHSQGIYAYNVSNISIVQSVFDHNGWSAVVPTAEDLGFNHDMYFASTCSGIDVEQNVIAEAAYAGIMARAGGVINNNLFVNDAISVAYGLANGADSTPGGVFGSLIGNITVGTKTYNYTAAAGQGFDIGNTKPGVGVMVSNNIFTHDLQNAKACLQLEMATGTYNSSVTVGENNVTLQNNIVNNWRQAVDLDSRFVDGGTGLYGFSALTVKNNDFINSTTQEVRHANPYTSTQESWSGDRYYDQILAQSNWVTLQGSSVPFSTWVSSYDLGAKLLPALTYPNPNVTIDSYDASIGGVGTYQDFLANADQMSILLPQTQYLALAAINYVQAGFGVPLTTSTGNTGSTGASGPPTASAASLNLNGAQVGTSTYSFTVNYIDSNGLKASSLGGGNLLVTGPNGFSQFAAYVSSAAPTTDSNGYQHYSATYIITAPNGAWAKGEDGTYTITMQANQVYDSFSSSVPDGTIGTFSADFTPPTAVATVSTLQSNKQGTSPYTFSVTYTDASKIDTSSLDNYTLRVTGPNNYSAFATLSNITGTGTSVTATYSLAAAGASWANGTYVITMAPSSVSDLAGNTVSGGLLATFVAQNGNGQVTGTSSIAGTIFNDANGNGTFDARENTLTGVTVFIDLAGTGAPAAGDPTATTDANGNYQFGSLVAGRYTIVEQVPAGFIVTAPTTTANIVTLTTGQTLTGVNFANQISTVVVSGAGGGSGGSTSGGSTGSGSSSTGVSLNSGTAGKPIIGTATGVSSGTVTQSKTGNGTNTTNASTAATPASPVAAVPTTIKSTVNTVATGLLSKSALNSVATASLKD